MGEFTLGYGAPPLGVPERSVGMSVSEVRNTRPERSEGNAQILIKTTACTRVDFDDDHAPGLWGVPELHVRSADYDWVTADD